VVVSFDTIPHDKLIKLVCLRITDKSVVKLLVLRLEAGVMEDGTITRNPVGTPQGGVISPLLANVYLNALDQLWVRNHLGDRRNDAHLIRYADDFVILCAKDPEKYLGLAKQRLDRLGLTLNSEKTKIKHVKEGFDFLGHTFRPSPVTGYRENEVLLLSLPQGCGVREPKREGVHSSPTAPEPAGFGGRSQSRTEGLGELLPDWECAGDLSTGGCLCHLQSLYHVAEEVQEAI